MATEPQSTLDKIIADAIDAAKDKAREEMLKEVESIGGHEEIRRLVAAEAERLLREDPEVKERLRAALIRALDRPTPKRWS